MIKHINIKKLIGIISFSLFVGIGCKKSTTSNNINLNQGLVAYYPFNGNANDESGNKLNGVISNSVTFSSDAAGKPKSAVTFDGVSGFILVSDSLGLLSPDIVSVSFLTNISNINQRAAFVNSVNFSDASGSSYSLGISVPNLARFQYGALGPSTGCAPTTYDQSTIIDNGYVISSNKWYSVVAVFSDSVQKFYINGSLRTAATRNYKRLNKCSGTSLVLGGWWQNDIVSLNGSLDEVRIYNRELNQDEINELAKPVK